VDEAPTIEHRLVARLHALRASIAAPVSAVLATAQRRVPASLAPWFPIAWLTLSAVLLALFAAVHARFYRARRHWPATELHGVRVRLSPEAGPAVVGLSRPEIVVPRWLLLRSPEEQRLTLAHEQEHVRARDPFLLAAACVAAVLLPWHPAVWWMLSRLRLAVELDCDGRVLRRGVAPRSYGTLLIDLAERCSGLGVGAAAFADASSHLERRLLAMKRNRPRFARARGGLLAAAALLALVAACDAPLPTSAEIEKMDVASAEAWATRVKMIESTNDSVVYMIDGRHASADQARALDPAQIAMIMVNQRALAPYSGKGGQYDEIQITTREAAGLAGGDGQIFVPVKSGAAAAERRATQSAATRGTRTLGVAIRTDRARVDSTFTGLIVIDGVLTKPSALNELSPHAIKSIEIIKGAASVKQFSDPRAAKGVIKITTHKSSSSK
jgi:beta-lactamase regulating signal transducer with metallopeptidase domain